MFIGEFLKGNKVYHKKFKMAQIIRTRKLLNAYNFCLSKNSIDLVRMFIGQFLKGNKMAP